MAVFDKFTGIGVASGFKLQAKNPLDGRLVVDSIADRDALITENGAYEGMVVYVKADKTLYKLDGTTAEDWSAIGGDVAADLGALTGRVDDIEEQLDGTVKFTREEKTKLAGLENYTHPQTEREDTTSAQTATHGGTVVVVDGVTSDDEGHITAINKKTVTLPAAPTSVSGNAGTATKLQTARTISVSGGATGTATSFDGSKNISIPITALDASKLTGTIDIARLPHGALERLVTVEDDEARFALTTSNVQTGDTVKVTSTGKMYFVVDDTKLSSEDGYEVYTAGSATSVPWSGVTGKPGNATTSKDGFMSSADKTKLDSLENYDDADIQAAVGAVEEDISEINTELNTKVDKVTGKGLSTNDYTTTEKNKLAGISEGATKVEESDTNGNIKVDGAETVVYTHPATAGNKHIPAGGAANQVLEYDQAGTAKWGHTVQSNVPANAKFTDTTYSNATTSTAGLMSPIDKTKVDSMVSVTVAAQAPSTAAPNSLWFKIDE